MLPFLLGITTLGSVRPYFRKHILDTLDPSDYALLNSIFITAFVVIYFVYIYAYDTKQMYKTYANCCKMSYTQIAALSTLSLFTVVSSLMLLNMEKYYNTPLINSVTLKGFSLVLLIIFGIFVFNEEYGLTHFVGIFFTAVGIFILLTNPIRQSVPGLSLVS